MRCSWLAGVCAGLLLLAPACGISPALAADSLLRPAPNARRLDALLAALDDRDPVVRWGAVGLLNTLVQGHADVVPLLIQRLENRSQAGRWAIAAMLGDAAARAAGAVPALVRSLSEADEELRDNSLAALVKIVSASPVARDALLELSRSSDEELRRAARHVLDFIGTTVRQRD